MADPQTRASGNGHTDCGTPAPSKSRIEQDSDTGELGNSVRNVLQAAVDFGQARLDGFRMQVRSAALKGALAIVAVFMVTTFLVVSMVLLLHGMAGGIAHLLNASPWLGNLLVGFVCLAVPLAVALIATRKLKRTWLMELKEKYESKNP